jgi:hypothetical protein
MDTSKLSRGEIIAAFGSLLLAIGVFLPAYETGNANANIDGAHGSLSIWQVHGILRILFLLAALAPIVLLWIVIRDHELSWPRGEMTAVIGLTAATLLFYIGIIDRPGEPSGQIALKYGWILAMVGAIMTAVGGAIRSSETARTRKPPGVL